VIVWKFKKRLRLSSLSIYFVAAIEICECILLMFVAMIWEPLLILTLLVIYVISMYACAVYSQITLGSYSSIGGRIAALFTVALLFSLFAIFLEKWILIPMAICVVGVGTLEFFMIIKIERKVQGHEGEEKFLDAVYYSLIIFRQKMMWFLIIFTMWYTIYKASNKKPEEKTSVVASNSDIKTI